MSDEKFYRIPQPVHPFPNVLPSPPVSPDDPDTLVCISVSKKWIPYILGALKVFQYDDVWEFPSEQLKNDGQTLLKQVMLYESCDGLMREIEMRSFPVSSTCVQYQWKYTDESISDWRTLSTVCNGDDAVCADCDTTPAYADPPPSQLPVDQNPRCLSAAAMTKAIRDSIEDSLEVFAAGGDVVSAGAGFAALLGVFGIAWAVVASLAFAMLSSLLNVLSSGGQVVYDESDWNDLECIFYCHLDANGRLDAASLAAVQSDVNARIPVSFEWEFIKSTIDIFGFEALNNSARLVIVSSADCVSCNCGHCYRYFGVGAAPYPVVDNLYVFSEAHNGYDAATNYTALGQLQAGLSLGVDGFAVRITVPNDNLIDSLYFEVSKNNANQSGYYTRVRDMQTNELIYDLVGSQDGIVVSLNGVNRRDIRIEANGLTARFTRLNALQFSTIRDLSGGVVNC